MKKYAWILGFGLSVLVLLPFVDSVSTRAEEAVDVGQTVYNKKCAMCHGKDGVAKKMATGSANLNDAEWQKGTSAEAIAKIIAEGKGKMPKNAGKLEPEVMEAIAKYVLTLE